MVDDAKRVVREANLSAADRAELELPKDGEVVVGENLGLRDVISGLRARIHELEQQRKKVEKELDDYHRQVCRHNEQVLTAQRDYLEGELRDIRVAARSGLEHASKRSTHPAVQRLRQVVRLVRQSLYGLHNW